MFTKSCEYSIQTMIYLAAQPRGTPVLLRDIASDLQIPKHFLAKMLQSLSRRGLVSSRKGKTGGFTLGKSPERISLYDIVEVIDGCAFLDNCVLGFPGCGDDHPCPVHAQWKPAKEIIVQMLKTRNVGELSKEINTKLDYIHSLREL
jgi:Rrf2 family protein